MRYLSLIVIVVVMAWTYSLSKEDRGTSAAVHGFLVQELKGVMSNYLRENVPGIENITFYRVYTETKKPNEHLLAYVKYSYESPAGEGDMAREVREGEFDLYSKDGGVTWEPHAKNFKDLNLEFLNELRITPRTGSDDEPALEPAEDSQVEI